MSSTRRNLPDHARLDSDDYETPPWCVHRLLEAFRPRGRRWLEPTAGRGALIKAVNRWHRDRGDRAPMTWTAADIQRENQAHLVAALAARGRVVVGDFLDEKSTRFARDFDLVLTNPPYRLAREVLIRSLELAPQVCLLLRMGFLESEARYELLSKNVPDLYVLPNRPSFAFGGTDSSTYAWMVWRRRPQRQGIVRMLALTPLSERRAAINETPRANATTETPAPPPPIATTNETSLAVLA